MKIQMGKRRLDMGGPYMTELRDANDILDDVEALRRRMDEDGYLLIRGFHDRDEVLAARGAILDELKRQGQIDLGHPLDAGVIAPGGKGGMLSRTDAASSDAFLRVVEGPRVMRFFRSFLGGEPATYTYKWLRSIPTGRNSGIHYDIVYMGRGTPNLYTVWTPYGDLSYDMGVLAVCLGSHRFEKIKETYGAMDVDRDNVQGSFSSDPVEIVDTFGGQWATTEYRAGDAIIFGMFTMHGSTTNTTDRFRLSSDTRYQLASEPFDERWIGENPRGHDTSKPAPTPIDDARRRWGV